MQIYSHKQSKKDSTTNLAIFLANKFIQVCFKSIKSFQTKTNQAKDKCVPFYNKMVTNQQLEDQKSSKLTNGNNLSHIDMPQFIFNKFEYLFKHAPFHTLQWLTSMSPKNKRLQTWLLDNMNIWVPQLLLNSKQSNIRFSTAILLANLVPNRYFRDLFTSNRNMLVPFRPNKLASVSLSTSSIESLTETKCEAKNIPFESEECKSILHKIIKYLLSLLDDVIKLSLTQLNGQSSLTDEQTDN